MIVCTMTFSSASFSPLSPAISPIFLPRSLGVAFSFSSSVWALRRFSWINLLRKIPRFFSCASKFSISPFLPFLSNRPKTYRDGEKYISKHVRIQEMLIMFTFSPSRISISYSIGITPYVVKLHDNQYGSGKH